MRRVALLAVLTAALAAAADASSPGRALMARPFPGDRSCNNTESGRHLIADSDGYVCPRPQLDVPSGCCGHAPPATRHACAACDADAQCCAAYEHCVSCCLAPANKAADLVKTEWRVGGRSETGRFATPFDYCAGKCRPTSVVTAHENEYISAAHFCYSRSGRPHTPPRPALPPLPPATVVVPADAGTSCASACAGRDLECGDAAPLADCNALRAAFGCEAGCDDAADGDAAVPAPAYVEPSADKSARPALCVVPAVGTAPAACDAEAGGVRRLCACAPPAGMK